MECGAVLDIVADLGCADAKAVVEAQELLVRIVSMLTRLSR